MEPLLERKRLDLFQSLLPLSSFKILLSFNRENLSKGEIRMTIQPCPTVAPLLSTYKNR